MNVLDRYLIFLFARIFSICFISISGLIIVVDTFSNLEEFLELGKQRGGLIPVLGSYYLPRIFLLFDQLCPVVALIAGICTLLWMRRSGELAAVEAGGIPIARMAFPIVFCTIIVLVLSVVNREMMIPRFRQELAKNAQSWDDSIARPVMQRKDYSSGIWIRGTNLILAENRINEPDFQLPNSLRSFSAKLSAEWAEFLPADSDHEPGYLFHNTNHPPGIDQLKSQSVDMVPVVLTRSEHTWIPENCCFVVSHIEPSHLANWQTLQRYSSTADLMTDLHNPSMYFSNRHRVSVHSRIVKPVLDLSILLIGLPLVISRRDRNVFFAAGICMAVVVGIISLNMVCLGLGAARLLNPASLAAWLPVMIVVPFAATSFRWLYR